MCSEDEDLIPMEAMKFPHFPFPCRILVRLPFVGSIMQRWDSSHYTRAFAWAQAIHGRISYVDRSLIEKNKQPWILLRAFSRFAGL